MRAMQTRPKHYYFRAAALDVSPDDACARLALYRSATEDGHSRAILRVTLREASQRHRISADLDGEPLKQIQWMGELFPPLTPEALPQYDQLRFFKVPVHLLTAGEHRLHAEAITLPCGGWRAIELALYNEHSFQ